MAPEGHLDEQPLLMSVVRTPARVSGALAFFSFLVFLGLHLQHMEFPRLGVQLELQLWAYTTATATTDPSCVCVLQHSYSNARSLTH